jgi:DNA-binding NtrC family response regulator
MTSRNGIIMVVNDTPDDARNIKELIEFMDVPQVCTSTPDNWRSLVGGHRLDAVFVGPDLSDKDFRSFLDDVGEFDPNVPIVILSEPTAQ